MTEAVVDLHGHQKKVMYVHWHPTAANILLSASKCFSGVLGGPEGHFVRPSVRPSVHLSVCPKY